MDLHVKYFISYVIKKAKWFALLKIHKEKSLEPTLTLILIKADSIRKAKKIVLFSFSEMIKPLKNLCA
jgi:hypothetical protein